MKIFGIILSVLYLTIFISLYILEMIYINKRKYYQSLKVYLLRFVMGLSIIFIGPLFTYLLIKSYSLEIEKFKYYFLIIIIIIPYIYDFVKIIKIKNSIMELKEIYKDDEMMKDKYEIENIEYMYEGKSSIYIFLVFSIIIYLMIYMFYYSFVEIIF